MDNLQRAKEERDKDKPYMEINGLMGDLWNVYTCNDPDETNKTNRVWDLLAAFKNQTLETQALALEGMKACNETLPHSCGLGKHEPPAYNRAIKQAADHLRAQKITE